MFSPRLFLICEPILSDSSRQESTQWHDNRFEFGKHLRSCGGVWDQVLTEARQLHAAGQLVRKEDGRVTEPVAVLAEPEEQHMDDHESNVSTEHTEDIERDHLRDPEDEWLEPLVGETGEEPPEDAPVAMPA